MDLTIDATRQPLTDATIVERIVAAVMEQKLPPGAKLPENALCDAFDCSRTQIRRILVVLAERGVVTLHPNRGAFVNRPSAEEARDVFEARRAIERSIVRAAAARIDRKSVAALRAAVATEAAAEARGARRESISLSGQFHMRLADIVGNAVMSRFLEDLIARTSLIIGLYGSTRAQSCSETEHNGLVDALAAHDAEGAAELMDHHLRHIEEALNIRERVSEQTDVRRIFGS